MTETPRNDDGEFTQLDTRKVHSLSHDKAIGEVSDEYLTPAVEFVNVDIELLEAAINRAKRHENMVRLGIVRKEFSDGDKEGEKGLVCLKAVPSDDESVVLASLTRSWDKEE